MSIPAIIAISLLGLSCLTAWPAAAEKARALVVGADKYVHLAPHAQLQRAINDARAVADALKGLSFETTLTENPERRAFNLAWQTFLDRITPGDVAIFYFAGHGVEIEGMNFLLPSDVPVISYGRQEQLKRESISVSELLLDLKRKKPRVVVLILDACREHPLVPPEFRNALTRSGLAGLEAPDGTFIMYSAGTGETALDRLPGKDTNSLNSLYTRMLVPLLRSGIGLADMARLLREDVSQAATRVGHRQRPAYYDGLIGRYCIASCRSEKMQIVEHKQVPTWNMLVDSGSYDWKLIFEQQRAVVFDEPLSCAGVPETPCRKLAGCTWSKFWLTGAPACQKQ